MKVSKLATNKRHIATERRRSFFLWILDWLLAIAIEQHEIFWTIFELVQSNHGSLAILYVDLGSAIGWTQLLYYY
jgi:hypothetical protein